MADSPGDSKEKKLAAPRIGFEIKPGIYTLKRKGVDQSMVTISSPSMT